MMPEGDLVSGADAAMWQCIEKRGVQRLGLAFGFKA